MVRHNPVGIAAQRLRSGETAVVSETAPQQGALRLHRERQIALVSIYIYIWDQRPTLLMKLQI
jgi:hypothetical protein